MDDFFFVFFGPSCFGGPTGLDYMRSDSLNESYYLFIQISLKRNAKMIEKWQHLAWQEQKVSRKTKKNKKNKKNKKKQSRPNLIWMDLVGPLA